MKKSANQLPFWEIQPNFEPMDLYDPAYPIHIFMSELKGKYEQSFPIVDQLVHDVIREAGLISEIENSLQKKINYVLDISEGTLQAIESGELKLNEENGKLFAQFRKLNGQYGDKISIRREEFSADLNVMQISNAIQMQALEKQLRNIADQIGVIDRNVKEVLQGQQNDRIGLYYSGLALFLEAKNIVNEKMRYELIGQALSELSTSISQLMLKIRSDIHYLIEKGYKKEKDRVKAIDQRMQSIHHSFAYIHQATMLKASIYCFVDELGTMATVLDRYSQFIKTTIAENASLLAQCDVYDNGTENGIWKSRAKLQLETAELVKQLNAKEKTLYLQILGEDKK